MPRHHRHGRSGDDDDRLDDDWNKAERHRKRRAWLVLYLPYAVFILVLLGIVFGAVYFVFSPRTTDERRKKMEMENSSSFTDRATAFKILELLESHRIAEAIALAETIADNVPGLERNIAVQITQRQAEVRRWLEMHICVWINIEHAAATQTTLSRRAGYPSASTPDVVVFFLCDFANYRARNFALPPREINDELLSRIFLQAADEKYRRLEARGEKPF